MRAFFVILEMMDVYINIAVLALGIYFLVKSGTHIVRSLDVMARYLGISEFVISFVLMAFATSVPELVVGINAALANDPELVLGNIIGTNIVNLSIIMGLIAVISSKVVLDDHEHFLQRRLFNFLLIISPLLLLLDGSLSRMDGAILLVLFIWNVARLLNLREMMNKEEEPAKKDIDRTISLKGFFKNLGIFLASNVVILGSAYFVVWSASNLSVQLGVPSILIGLFVIGIGTSLPELSFGISSASSGNGGMSLGNLFGSAVANSTLILGVTALIRPIFIDDGIFWISSIFLVLTLLIGFYLLRTKDYLDRKEGLILVFVYIVFIIAELGHKFIL